MKKPQKYSYDEYFPKELANKTYEKFNKVKSDFEMVCQSQKDILNSFNNYEIIFDEKNECKKQDLNKFIDSEIENKTQKNSKITIDSNLDEKIEEEETNSEKLFINGLGKNEKKI